MAICGLFSYPLSLSLSLILPPPSSVHGTVKWQVIGLGCLRLFYPCQTICRPSFHSHTLGPCQKSSRALDSRMCMCALHDCARLATLDYPTLPYRKLPYPVTKFRTSHCLPTSTTPYLNKLCSNHCATPASRLSFVLRWSLISSISHLLPASPPPSPLSPVLDKPSDGTVVSATPVSPQPRATLHLVCIYAVTPAPFI